MYECLATIEGKFERSNAQPLKLLIGVPQVDQNWHSHAVGTVCCKLSKGLLAILFRMRVRAAPPTPYRHADLM
jgi:hypothetical protein